MLHRGNIVNLAALVLLLQLALPVSGLGGQSPESAPGRTWAVVIGIAKYSKLPGGFQLQFPDQDARAFSSAIKAAGVPAQNVKTLIGSEATVDAIRSAIGSWLPRAASPNDTVYIFFSGHGYVERDFNESYLLAYDSDPQNIYSTAISAADIEYILDHRLKARHVLFLQDAERRDFFGNDETGRADSSTFASSFSHLASSRPGISLITASSPGEFSWEG
ncbi:MAG TPA: caspase family protein, partial [Blastocatellia bacterium]|nr:caspase family protein [Blastocatellia bacterium]